EIFDSLPATLEIKDLGEKSTMLASDGSEIAEFYWQNRVEVPLDEISEDMQNATIAVEDYRYFEHGGVDIEGIARAAVHNMVSATTQGGSTLTQQYVKNVLLRTPMPKRTPKASRRRRSPTESKAMRANCVRPNSRSRLRRSTTRRKSSTAI